MARQWESLIPQLQAPSLAERPLLPRPPAPPVVPGGFVAYPVALMQGLTSAQHAYQRSLYQIAFEQAQAVVRPALPERDILGYWN